MSAPPGYMPAIGFGGTTSPSKVEMVKAARLILDNCGVPMSQNKLMRLVLRFIDRAPNGSGHAFFLYLTSAVQMSEKQKRAALLNPDIARVVSYADPTGEQAVNNVMSQR